MTRVVDSHIPGINFPLGAAGNQLRWLLYMDSAFPSLDGGNKLAFIQQQVYPAHRTWSNWLYHEMAWRPQLDSVIQISHYYWGWQESNSKQLYLTMQDIDLPYLHYFHLNLDNNHYHGTSESHKLNQQWAQEFEYLKSQVHQFPNIKLIYGDCLFEQTLSREFYTEVIDFFGFEDHYDLAAVVQQLYHQCRTNSMREFYNYFAGPDFHKYVEMIRTKFLTTDSFSANITSK